jgi:hypothetical protein
MKQHYIAPRESSKAPSDALYEELNDLLARHGSIVCLSAWGEGSERLTRPRIYLLAGDCLDQILDHKNVWTFGSVVMAAPRTVRT